MTSQEVPPGPAYEAALAEWTSDLKPRGVLERTLVERACRAAWTLRRCDRHQDATAARRDRDAPEAFDLDEAHRAEALGRRLLALIDEETPGDGEHSREHDAPEAGDPALLVAELRRTAAGASWMVQRWTDLGKALGETDGWDTSHARVAGRLLGLRDEAARAHPLLSRVESRAIAAEAPGGGSWFDHPGMHGVVDEAEEAAALGLDPGLVWRTRLREIAARERGGSEADASLRKALRALVRSEREKLARLVRKTLKARADEDRASAADRAMFDESRSMSLCLRYAGAASRDLHRAIRELARLRESSAEDEDSSSQAPAPPSDVPTPGSTGDDEPNRRNEANEEVSTPAGDPEGPAREARTASESSGRSAQEGSTVTHRPPRSSAESRVGDRRFSDCPLPSTMAGVWPSNRQIST